jgi:hypothetical protein
MCDKYAMRSIFAFLILIFLGPDPAISGESGVPATQALQVNDKTVVDQVFQKILDQAFTVTLEPLSDMKAHAEELGFHQYLLTVNVTLKAAPAGRETLEATARQLGGLSMDANLEVDVGMVTLAAHVVRISNDPRTTEYFQRRVGSLAFIVELSLDNGETYACATGDPWRLPITPAGQLYSFRGGATIQYLGVSPAFDTKDYGFVAIRKEPISFKYRVTIPETDLKRLTKVEGKVIERNGTELEGECLKVGKPTARTQR